MRSIEASICTSQNVYTLFNVTSPRTSFISNDKTRSLSNRDFCATRSKAAKTLTFHLDAKYEKWG